VPVVGAAAKANPQNNIKNKTKLNLIICLLNLVICLDINVPYCIRGCLAFMAKV
jgi:hypothetical protein